MPFLFSVNNHLKESQKGTNTSSSRNTLYKQRFIINNKLKMKQLFTFLIFFSSLAAFSQSATSVLFDYCEAESHLCQSKCKVQLIEGKKLSLGSYVKVYSDKEILIAEGYILKHVNGDILILKSKKDAENRDIGGGCKDPTLSIDLKKKQIWVC